MRGLGRLAFQGRAEQRILPVRLRGLEIAVPQTAAWGRGDNNSEIRTGRKPRGGQNNPRLRDRAAELLLKFPHIEPREDVHVKLEAPRDFQRSG